MASEKIRSVIKPAAMLKVEEGGASAPELLQGRSFDVILAINLIHISPYSATIGLMKMAAQTMSDESFLILYGPFVSM